MTGQIQPIEETIKIFQDMAAAMGEICVAYTLVTNGIYERSDIPACDTEGRRVAWDFRLSHGDGGKTVTFLGHVVREKG